MRVQVFLAILIAIGVAGVVLFAGQAVLQPNRPLLEGVRLSDAVISPNADGNVDLTEIQYTLTRNATITITFESADGTVYAFRQDEPRTPNDYRVLFSGVVDGYLLPGEEIRGVVERRLMPDGVYTWRVVAVAEDSAQETQTGTFTIQESSAELPLLTSFSVSPTEFTPNQDGIADRVSIDLYVEKPADLTVYLVGPQGQPIYVPQVEDRREEGEAGRHIFDYDGGIDNGMDPPPDGTYTVVAIAQDLAGQRIRRETTLELRNGGDPKAEIVPQPNGLDVVFLSLPYDDRYAGTADQPGVLLLEPQVPVDLGFSQLTLPVGNMLTFRLVVENYGSVPIRTSGPWPGAVYQQDQVWGSSGVYEESGAWKIGINCQTTTVDFPWRWAVGSPDELIVEEDPVTGQPQYYLPAGARSTVWGAVRFTRIIEARNPQQCWAGLIHEDVRMENPRVGARDIELVAADTGAGS
jgi:hypothetical protein